MRLSPSRFAESVRRLGRARRAVSWQVLTVGLAIAGYVAVPVYAQIAVRNQGYIPYSDAPINYRSQDLTDPVALLTCSQVTEGLYGYDPGTAAVTPQLARTCEPNENLTEWTCRLRNGVTFHDGSSLDASDVVSSFAAQWDAESPLHAGREGAFVPFARAFGGFLNPSAAKP